jgi:hypothetical protein
MMGTGCSENHLEMQCEVGFLCSGERLQNIYYFENMGLGGGGLGGVGIA